MANPILQLLEALRNMFTCDIGIDLGTANTLVYMKGRGIIIREPSVVAVDARTDELRVRCVGHEAKAIIGAAPNSILAVRPLKDGVIADFDITAAMLQSFIRQACGSRLFVRPRVVICVPSGVTEVERRAVRQAADGMATALREQVGGRAGWEVLGPTDCVKARVKDQVRRHVMVKAPSEAALGAVLSSCAASLGRLQGINMALDVDAYDMM